MTDRTIQLTLLANEEVTLKSLEPLATSKDLIFSKPKRVTRDTTLEFDVGATMELLWQIVGVVSTVGGAVAFVGRLKSVLPSVGNQSLIVKVGDEEVIVRTVEDIARIDELLKKRIGSVQK
jgi:hypothetical protein